VFDGTCGDDLRGLCNLSIDAYLVQFQDCLMKACPQDEDRYGKLWKFQAQDDEADILSIYRERRKCMCQRHTSSHYRFWVLWELLHERFDNQLWNRAIDNHDHFD
jgi:hypothetical protein